jgi:chromosome segregation ATPase
MKISHFLFAVLCACLFIGCNNEENAKLRAENDSLRAELETRYSVVVNMREIKGLLDSIDANRNVIHINLMEGTSYDAVKSRLVSINQYVQRTEERITSVEDELKSSTGKASAYLMMVDALKDELHTRLSEIETLETEVDKYKDENKGLQKTIKFQATELVEIRTQLVTKQQELQFIEAKVDELVDNFKVTEAEALYARALAVEEAAKRTKLAPQKKKETYREALELYKKALSLGHKEAQKKIDELQPRVR